MPAPETRPPRNPGLGKSENDPGISCADIKEWGAQGSQSGQYFIKPSGKAVQKVFCDMETDMGGWTLFFNYIHEPGTEITLDPNKLPSDIKTNSHMYLQNAGFSFRDVQEIRFLCNEKYNTEHKYWHFKTNNQEIISVAMNGMQANIDPSNFSRGYVPIPPPSSFDTQYINAVDIKKVKEFQYVTPDQIGGLTKIDFGANDLEVRWIVKGDDSTPGIYQCGSQIKQSNNNNGDNASMVFTHHSIWFRGKPLTEDEVRERNANIANSANNNNNIK